MFLAGYFVLGMGYGIYVQSLGLPVWMPMLMGTVVYGGSLEFVLASLLLNQSFYYRNPPFPKEVIQIFAECFRPD